MDFYCHLCKVATWVNYRNVLMGEYPAKVTMNVPMVKIYGERNTGTNYLTKLMERNFLVKLLPGVVPKYVTSLQKYFHDNESVRDLYFRFTFPKNLGWKHSLVKPVDHLQKYKITSTNLFFITLTKNPYSWLLSLYKKPYHSCIASYSDFDDFLIMPWGTVQRENSPLYYKNPIDLWNCKNRSYLQLGDRFYVD
jgi:hypothetical protein